MKAKGVVRECEHDGRQHSHGYECYRFDGCRCDLGRAHYAQATARRRKLKAMGRYEDHFVDATGADRRVKALMTLGYTVKDISEMCGLSRNAIYNISRNERPTRLRREHAEAVSNVYNELSSTEAPDGHGSRYLKSLSRGRGYAPPLAWDEDSIDDPSAEPNLFGFRPDQLNAELSYRLAVQMVKSGFQYKEIILNTGLKNRGIYEIKKLLVA